MEYIIGLDTGTSNTKAIAFSKGGEILATASAGYGYIDGLDKGFNEQDPEALFAAMIDCINDVVEKLPSDKLLGISFSSAMHSLIAMDANGSPLTNVITWADLRSAKEADELKNTTEGIGIYQRTGTPIHPMSPLCKLLWLKRNEGDLFKSAAMFISIKEYFFFRLFGYYVVDHSIASATGLFDISSRQWDPVALNTAGIKTDQLSKPVSPYFACRGLRSDIVEQLKIELQLPFIIGGSDGCLANLGSSAVEHGDMSITIGTSGAVRMMTTTPQVDNKRRIFNYILDDEFYVSGGPVNNGGVLLKWYATQFLHKEFNDASDFEWFVDEACEAPAGCEGLVFLPYVQGERAPIWDALAKGAFVGLHGLHTQTHMMRAIVEAICFSLYDVSQTLVETIGPIKNIYASGGFIRSQKWLQILSDIFNKPVRLSNAADASAVGASLIGLKALGVISDLQHPVNVEAGDVIYPNPEMHDVYMKNYAVYSKLYDQLKFSFHL